MDAWDLVIFDNDGVLVDSESIANETLAGLLTDCGWPMTTEACVAAFLGGTIQAVREWVEAEGGPRLPDDFEQCYQQGIFERFSGELRAVPGVAAVVEMLGERCCVASSGSWQRIHLTLELTGLLDLFGDRLFSAEAVARGKPAPDLFLHAAACLGVPAARTVVVEDSPFGVAAARAAGMTAFGYAGLTPAERLGDADAVFTTMGELPALLGLRPRGTQ